MFWWSNLRSSHSCFNQLNSVRGILRYQRKERRKKTDCDIWTFAKGAKCTPAAVYSAQGGVYAFCFQSFCSSSNLLTSVCLGNETKKKIRLRGKRQTVAPCDAWLRRLPAGAANLRPVTGPTLRMKPPAARHRWDTTELAHPFASLIHFDLIILFTIGEG